MEFYLEHLESCTGCGACYNICKNGALHLIVNEKGFLKPHIQENLCTGCNQCKKVCPIVSEPISLERKVNGVYAAWAKDNIIHKNSNSGGMFFVFAKKVIEKEGVVCAARYSADMKVYHDIAERIEEIKDYMYSKFSQSDMKDCFKRIKKYLQEKRRVLFVGTPCQVTGLYSFLGGDNSYLLTVQFPCLGIPSSKALEDYLIYYFKVKPEMVDFLYCEVQEDSSFKDRFMKCVEKDGTQRRSKADTDPFVRLWNKGMLTEERCFTCKENVLPAKADFLWGNFWQLGEIEKFPAEEKEYQDGVSFLILESEKAASFFKEIKEEIVFYKRKKKEVITGHYCMQVPTAKHLLMKHYSHSKERLKEEAYREEFHTSLEKNSEEREKKRKTGKILFQIKKKLIVYIWRIFYYIHLFIK